MACQCSGEASGSPGVKTVKRKSACFSKGIDCPQKMQPNSTHPTSLVNMIPALWGEAGVEEGREDKGGKSWQHITSFCPFLVQSQRSIQIKALGCVCQLVNIYFHIFGIRYLLFILWHSFINPNEHLVITGVQQYTELCLCFPVPAGTQPDMLQVAYSSKSRGYLKK